MAYGKQSQHALFPGSLAIQWSLEMGHLQPRWAVTRQPKPYRVGWLGRPGNAIATEPAAAYALGRTQARKLWAGLLDQLCWFMQLFSQAAAVLDFQSSFKQQQPHTTDQRRK